MRSKILLSILTVVLAGCVTVGEDNNQQRVNRTVSYGIGSAAACAALGGVTAPDGKGGRHARNAALACGALGAIAGSVVENSAYALRRDIATINPNIGVVADSNQLIRITIPESDAFTDSTTMNAKIYPVLQKIIRHARTNPAERIEVYSFVNDQNNQVNNQDAAKQEATAIGAYLRSNLSSGKVQEYPRGSQNNANSAGNHIEIHLLSK